jgi:predicted enzyme related to lactoylglutathione lyase
MLRMMNSALRALLGLAFVLLAGGFVSGAALGPDGEPGVRHPGKFIWFDLATENPDDARAFYGAVFGWKFITVAGPNAPYTLIEDADSRIGGMFRQARPAGAPVGSRWIAVMSVSDPAQAARYVRDNGGQVLIAPRAVPGRGTHALFRDPQGAVFGVLAASDGDPRDTPVIDGDVFWLDLFTPDPARAASFYAGLAGYAVSELDLPGKRARWILATEGIARAGIVNTVAGKPGPGWMPYILVDDVTTTLKRVTAAGGRVIVLPSADLLDGNVAVIADRSGGVLGIVNWDMRVDAGAPSR